MTASFKVVTRRNNPARARFSHPLAARVQVGGRWETFDGITNVWASHRMGTLTFMRGKERAATFILDSADNAQAVVQRPTTRVATDFTMLDGRDFLRVGTENSTVLAQAVLWAISGEVVNP